MEWLSRAQEMTQQGQAVVLVTIVGAKGSVPRALGTKMLVTHAGRVWGSIGGGRLEKLATEDAILVLDQGLVQKIEYPLSAKAGQCCGGVVELLFEPLNTNPLFFVFGAGHIGSALARLLGVGTGFRVHLIDPRADWLNSPEIPQGVTRHLQNPLEFVSAHPWQASRSWAVVMTHDHDLDYQLLMQLAPLSLAYLGLIGSKTKWSRFRQRLSAAGVGLAELDRVRCPVGLKIGAETPEEISVSIAAEVIGELKSAFASKTLWQQDHSETSSGWSSVEDDPCESPC